jgi:hypothetical protein
MLFAGGCTVTTTSTHTLDSGLFTVPAGSCALLTTAGPYSVPSGTDFDLTLSDSAGSYDQVDLTIIDSSLFPSCDFSGDGPVFTDVFATGGNQYPSALNMPSGLYDVYGRCLNPGADCQFSMVWDATY